VATLAFSHQCPGTDTAPQPSEGPEKLEQDLEESCKDATPDELYEALMKWSSTKEWEKGSTSCEKLEFMCDGDKHGELMAKLCPLTCDSCIKPETSTEDRAGGSGAMGVVVAIVAGVAVVGAGFAAVAYYRLKYRRDALQGAYVGLERETGDV